MVRRLILFLSEGAAEDGAHVEDIEPLRIYRTGLDQLGHGAAGEVEGLPTFESDGFKNVGQLCGVSVVGGGDHNVVELELEIVSADGNESIGVSEAFRIE